MPVRSYDRLAYPAGFAAGHDPGHPAVCGTVYVSAVARGADGFHAAFINMMNGGVSTRSGGQVADGFDGRIGPYHITGSFNQTVFVGAYPASTIFYTGTMATILRVGTSYPNDAHLININTGTWLNITTAGEVRVEFPGSVFPFGAGSGINPVLGGAYFLFVSWNITTVDFVVRNLETGQVSWKFNEPGVSAPHTSSATGEFSLGCDGSGGGNGTTRIAAAMFQTGCCPGEVGLQWAEDPWAFWYPRRYRTVGLLSGPVFTLYARTLDYGLAALADDCDKIHVCSAGGLTDYASAVAQSLGNKDFGVGGAFGVIAAGSPTGRKVTSVAISNGSITATGTVDQWAAVDSVNSRLLASGPLTGGKAVTSGQNFTLASFVVRES